jgi:triacylglycerol lipase
MVHWLVTALLSAAPALAQPPAEIAAELARIGRVIEVPRTAALYVPLHPAGPHAGVRILRDAAYGPDPRQRLDVFAPEAGGMPGRVLVFVHGGGFVGGGKRLAVSDRFYDNIALWAVRQGMVGVNITYRLAPAHPYPAAQEDLAAALAWVARNIPAQGGDPSQIFVMGHSAGAVHIALYAAEPRFHPPGVAPPRGFAFVSGLFAFGAGAGDGVGERAYFGEDEAARRGRSPGPGLVRAEAPMFFAFAELNPPRFNDQAAATIQALREAGRTPVVVPLPGHSHISEVFAIGTDDTSLTAPLGEFLRR